MIPTEVLSLPLGTPTCSSDFGISVPLMGAGLSFAAASVTIAVLLGCSWCTYVVAVYADDDALVNMCRDGGASDVDKHLAFTINKSGLSINHLLH